MTTPLRFDMRLWNPYAVDDFEASHPALHAALQGWFGALRGFDESALAKLVNAKGAEAMAAAKEKGEVALASCPGVAGMLEPVVRELQAAIAATDDPSLRTRLQGLLESAGINRTAFLEGAPAAVATARTGTGGYDAIKARATQALEDAASRLHAMAARSDDAGAPFSRLQPLIGELKSLWNGVDEALKPIARAEQRAIRAPFDATTRPLASRLCNNLHAALTRDRAAGTLARPEIVEPDEGDMSGTVAADFARALARHDFEAAHATLAPWLRSEWSALRLKEALSDDVANTMTFYEGMQDPPAPGSYTVHTNSTGYADLAGDPAESLPAGLTADNFVAWCPIDIHTAEDDAYLTNWDTYCSLFVVIARTDEGERIGYLRIGE